MKKRRPDPEAIKRMRKGHAGGRYHELRLMTREEISHQTVQEKRAYYVGLLQELASRNLVGIEQEHHGWVWKAWHPQRPERVAFWTSGSGRWHIPAMMEHRAIVEPRVQGRYLASLMEALGVKEDKGTSIEAWLRDLERRER